MRKCAECGSPLESPSVSHSELGQWIHDNFPNTFYWMDLDGVIYKRATKILRIVEWKHRGQRLKSSQNTVLPLLAKGIDFLKTCNLISSESGVFVVWSCPPFKSALVRRISDDEGIELSEFELKLFVTGMSMKTTALLSMP